jgi:hypothetical protein
MTDQRRHRGDAAPMKSALHDGSTGTTGGEDSTMLRRRHALAWVHRMVETITRRERDERGFGPEP